MAGTPLTSHSRPSSPPPLMSPSVPNNGDTTEYWCFQCEKHVRIETLADQLDVICSECKNGFIELKSIDHDQPLELNDELHLNQQPATQDEIFQIIRLLDTTVRADNLVSSDDTANYIDFRQIQFQAWITTNSDDNENEGDANHDQENHNQGSDDHNESIDEQSPNFVRFRIRDLVADVIHDLSSRNQDHNWDDLLPRIGDSTIEIMFQDPEDAARYVALIQGQDVERETPPAANFTIEALPSVEVTSCNIEDCVVCKDKLFSIQGWIVKQLPCGHMYHQDCIVPWLGMKKTCPVCRFELCTDDP